MAVVVKYRESVGEVDIIHPLCYNLTKLTKSEVKLLHEMINSLDILLQLDNEYPDFLEGSDTVT